MALSFREGKFYLGSSRARVICLHSFYQYLLSTYGMSGSAVGTGIHSEQIKQRPLPSWSSHSRGEGRYLTGKFICV